MIRHLYPSMVGFKGIVVNNMRCALGQKRLGVKLGGDVIVSRLQRKLENGSSDENSHIVRVVDFNEPADYSKAYKLVKNTIRQSFLVNLGGDHSISACTIQPLIDVYQDDLLVVWVDAHPDLNTLETSVSKNTHGMPVSSLLGLQSLWFGGSSSSSSSTSTSSDNINDKHHHHLKPENLVYFGLRDIDPPEANVIEKLRITVCSSPKELRAYIAKHPAKHIHLSIDIDGLDPQVMPSTGTPVDHGLSLSSVKKVIIACLPRLISVDLAEFNPLVGGHDGDVEHTLDNILELLKTVSITLSRIK